MIRTIWHSWRWFFVSLLQLLSVFLTFLFFSSSVSASSVYWEHFDCSFSSGSSSYWNSQMEYRLGACQSSYGECSLYFESLGMGVAPCGSNAYRSVYRVYIGSAPPVQCDDPLIRDPETNTCVEPAKPSECHEVGEMFDVNTQQCTPVCEHGVLSGICLNPPPENEESCNSNSSDYQGYLDFGMIRHNVCETDRQCEGGQFGLVNGRPNCIPDDYGPSTCAGDGVLIMDDFGYVCEATKDNPNPEPEPEPEAPNTDTTGDGEPDTYDPANDPVSTDKAVDKTTEAVDKATQEISKSNQNLDRIYGAVKEIAEQGAAAAKGGDDAVSLIQSNTSDVGNFGDAGLDLTEHQEIDVSAKMGDWQNVGDPTVGECPAPTELKISLGTFQVVWEPWCDFAARLRPFTIFMFSFIGAMAIARTFTS